MELNREQILHDLHFFHKRMLDTKLGWHIYEREAMAVVNAQKLIEELAEENKKLKTELLRIVEQDIPALAVEEMMNTHTSSIMKSAYDIAIRKMQERLKEQQFSHATPHDYDILHYWIDGVAKELLGGKER